MKSSTQGLDATRPAVIRFRPGRKLCAMLLAAALAGCSTLGASGPSTGAVRGAHKGGEEQQEILVLDLDSRVVAALAEARARGSFAQMFGETPDPGERVGIGDAIEVQIWEAPPAVLFGSASSALAAREGIETSAATRIGPQRIGAEGTITVPFAGAVRAAGRRAEEIAADIRQRLAARAHDPQVTVRIASNQTRNVTVIGEVGSSRLVPLSARGERLLDAIAAAGGPRHPVGKSSVQLTRANRLAVMPLDRVIADPTQNVALMPGDIVTVLHQPFSFVALGSVGRSAQIDFEGSGLSLAEALGRVGGLNDQRADIKGVFVFRMEDPSALGTLAQGARTTLEGKMPVIYRLDLSDPASLFAMQDFAIRDKDVLYVSSAPGSDLQRFISTISSAAFSIVGISNAIGNGN